MFELATDIWLLWLFKSLVGGLAVWITHVLTGPGVDWLPEGLIAVCVSRILPEPVLVETICPF